MSLIELLTTELPGGGVATFFRSSDGVFCYVNKGGLLARLTSSDIWHTIDAAKARAIGRIPHTLNVGVMWRMWPWQFWVERQYRVALFSGEVRPLYLSMDDVAHLGTKLREAIYV